MSPRRLVLGFALLALPSLTSAQKSRAASGRDKTLMDDAGKNRPSQVTARDLEEQSPIKLLIDKRKDLKLSDAQLTQIKDVESKLKTQNASLYKVVDSVNNEMRPKAGADPMSDEVRARMRNGRQEMMSVIKDIQNNYDAALKEAVGGLNEEQQKKAADLVEKQKNENETFLRDRLGGGRERP
jgi:hypothetical protein